MFITLLQQIIYDKLLLVGRRVILAISLKLNQ